MAGIQLVFSVFSLFQAPFILLLIIDLKNTDFNFKKICYKNVADLRGRKCPTESVLCTLEVLNDFECLKDTVFSYIKDFKMTGITLTVKA